MSYVAAFDLELHQMGVVTAFLYGDIDQDMYVEQPEVYVDVHRPTHCMA